MAKIAANFEPEKVTDNKVKFKEVVEESFLAVAKVGILYVPKRTLADMGWDGTAPLKVTVEA